MDTGRARMIYLGYGKYWRADEIVGLLPIETGRGPGRRTEVYVATREDPIVASRSQETILNHMARSGGGAGDEAEMGRALDDLLSDLESLPPVLRRMIGREGDFDVSLWIRRLRELRGDSGSHGDGDGQEDLFVGD